jgi:RNA polymerase sigma factor (sigma-70 family)
MNDPQAEFQVLLKQAREGSAEATRKLIDCYTPHILRAVRRKLSKSIRPKFDSLDFTQAVWASFFAGIDQWANFQRPEDLVGYLAAMAHHKVIDELRRRLQTDKYNINRERSLNDSNHRLREALPDRGPSPSQVAADKERWDQLTEELPERSRRALELRRAGHSYEEIAQEVGLDERSVRRIIRILGARRTPPADAE